MSLHHDASAHSAVSSHDRLHRPLLLAAAASEYLNDIPSVDASSLPRQPDSPVLAPAPNPKRPRLFAPMTDVPGRPQVASASRPTRPPIRETPSFDHDSASADTEERRATGVVRKQPRPWVRHEAGWRFPESLWTGVDEGRRLIDVEDFATRNSTSGLRRRMVQGPKWRMVCDRPGQRALGWYHEESSWYHLGSGGTMADMLAFSGGSGTTCQRADRGLPGWSH